MQACLLRGSSLHLCLKAGQLSVVTITRRCRCYLDELNIQNVFITCNTIRILIFAATDNILYFMKVYFSISSLSQRKLLGRIGARGIEMRKKCVTERRSAGHGAGWRLDKAKLGFYGYTDNAAVSINWD